MVLTLRIERKYFFAGLIVLGLILGIGGVYAEWKNPVTGVGHDLDELETVVCTGNQVLQQIGYGAGGVGVGFVCVDKGGGGGQLNCGNEGKCTDVYATTASEEAGFYAKADSNNIRASLVKTSGGVGILSLFDSNGINNVKISPMSDTYFNGGEVGIGTTVPA